MKFRGPQDNSQASAVKQHSVRKDAIRIFNKVVELFCREKNCISDIFLCLNKKNMSGVDVYFNTFGLAKST